MNYRLLGPSGLRVSEICLGTMTFGTEWGWGTDKAGSQKIFDAYAEAGGNFIDTANRYTEGTSERFVGEFIKADRDHFVLATKYTLFDKLGDPNYSGNHRKNMVRSVEASLARLNTDFIDLLWVHAWDGLTPIQEVMRGLDDLVKAGKVHYLGISDTPAWVVAKANTLAQFHGWTPFVAYQGEYSLIQRDAERDILPMCQSEGLAFMPWAPLGGGVLTGKYLKGEPGRIKAEHKRRGDRALAIAQRVVEVAERMRVSPAQVAVRWSMQQPFTSIPIVGATHLDQIQENLKAAHISIPEQELASLHEASAIEKGFPHDFLASDGVQNVVFGGSQDQIVK